MTRNEFDHLLSSLKDLSPGQVRQLRQKIDSELSDEAPRGGPPKKPPAQKSTKGVKRTKAASSPAKKPMTKVASHKKQPLSPEELNQRLLASGLVTRLPDPAQDIDDDDDPPIVIKGEPLSETIIRERR